ncbi:MAG: hypothetical protein JWQ38_2955 [Flavipsychrobacter sp.]|nr:hypothetical protein [Flavipsychrobacter sp.]
MRFFILLTLVAFCYTGLYAQELPRTQIINVNTGKKVAFNEACEKGKVTLVTFWGTWCAHGKREVKTLAGKLAAWKKQADFNYITIVSDQHEQHSTDVVRAYTLSQHWSFPCYVDPNSELKYSLNFTALPYSIVIDKHGRIVYLHTGYDEGGDILVKLKELTGARKK